MEGSQEYLLELDRRENDLRDRFAMAALTGILACDGDWTSHEQLSSRCYKVADAMLKARGNAVGAVSNTQNTMGSSEKAQ